MAKKKGGGAHGGHGWFVTFADLMALLMSFFVMIAAYSTQDQKKLQLVAGSMRDAFGVTKESRFAGIVEKDGLPDRRSTSRTSRDVSPEKADRPADAAGRRCRSSMTACPDAGYPDGAGLAAACLRQAMQDMPEIAELSKNIIVEEQATASTSRWSTRTARSMFPDGSSQPYDRTRRLLERLAPAIRKMANRIAVTGYTATDRPGTRPAGPALGALGRPRHQRARDPGRMRRARRPLRLRRRQGRHRADVSRQPLPLGQPPGDDDSPQRGAADPVHEDAAVAAPCIGFGSMLHRATSSAQ